MGSTCGDLSPLDATASPHERLRGRPPPRLRAHGHVPHMGGHAGRASAMADRIGVARRWLRTPPKASWVHFDISLGKKARALRYGAILTDRFRPGRVPGAWRSAPARVRSSTNACADSVTRAGSRPGCLRKRGGGFANSPAPLSRACGPARSGRRRRTRERPSPVRR